MQGRTPYLIVKQLAAYTLRQQTPLCVWTDCQRCATMFTPNLNSSMLSRVLVHSENELGKLVDMSSCMVLFSDECGHV